MSDLRGVLHTPDGLTVRVALEWRIGGRSFAVRSETVSMDVPVDGVTTRAGGWRGGALHLVWETAEGTFAVTVDDPEGLAALEERAPPRLAEAARVTRTAGRRSTGRLRLLVGGLVALVLLPLVALGLLIVHPDPLLDAVVPRLPTVIDERVGDAVKAHTEATGSVLADGPVVDAVRSIGARLLAHAPEHPFTFEFAVVRDETANAFAAPGGYVVVHTGLLERAASGEEVAGVLAHELAHVLERHSMRQLTRRAGLVALLSATVGPVDGLGGVLVDGAANLTDLAFSRDQERAADDLGHAILRAAALRTDGLATFFDRLAEEQTDVPALFSTHPDSAERAARLRARSEGEPPADLRPLDLDWESVRRALEELR